MTTDGASRAWLRVVIPGVPPSWTRFSGTGGVRKSFHQNDYGRARMRVGWLLTNAMRRAGGGAVFRASRLELEVELRYPDRRVRDADRALNLVLDAGKDILWSDDSWTRFEDSSIVLRPKLDAANPGMTIVVRCVGALRVEPDPPKRNRPRARRTKL